MSQFPGGLGAGGMGDLVKHAQKAMGDMQKIQSDLDSSGMEPPRNQRLNYGST